MIVGLFTHRFLEPTHYSIAQLIAGLDPCEFWIFAKHFEEVLPLTLPNVSAKYLYRKGRCSKLDSGQVSLVHTIYDGKTALRAGEVARAAGLPLIVSFHGGYDTHEKIFDPRYTSLTRELIENSAATTVICAADELRLKQIGVQRSVSIIPVPIDFGMLPPKGTRDPHELLVVARFIPKKGIDIAIRSLIYLPATYHLTIIGDGICRDALKDLALSLRLGKRVSWLGFQPLPATLARMNTSGILLHPARVASDGNADGNPQVILWAQAMGLPVVTTATGNISEIVTDQVTGLMVEADNPSQLAEAVVRLNQDSALQLKVVNTAKESVIFKHNILAICNAYRALYHQVSHGTSL